MIPYVEPKPGHFAIDPNDPRAQVAALYERAKAVGLWLMVIWSDATVDAPSRIEYVVRQGDGHGRTLAEGNARELEPFVEDVLRLILLEEQLARQRRVEVRNPILGMPAAAKLRALDPTAKAALREILMELRADAQRQADRSWRKHKAPMAVYWKAVAVYAGHIARALR